jgi:hypothetical protein
LKSKSSFFVFEIDQIELIFPNHLIDLVYYSDEGLRLILLSLDVLSGEINERTKREEYKWNENQQ